MARQYSKKERCTIIRQEQVAPDIYSMWIRTEAAKTAHAGQFANIFCRDKSHLMPRPISIAQIDRDTSALRFVYKVSGEGTASFVDMKSGENIDIIAPLGNGFPICDADETAILIGGGIGIPPMLELARELKSASQVVLGYKDIPFLKEEFEATGSRVYVATESGSMGTKGNVIGAIMENNLGANVIYACGPRAMLSAIKKYAALKKMRCYVSMEERMACGIGACLGCVVKTKKPNEHTKVSNACVCADGPVFLAEEVAI